MASSQLFIVRIRHDPRRFVASARRIDDEVFGEFVQPEQLLSFLLGRPADSQPRAQECPDPTPIAPERGFKQPTR
jgi:hypothetical protein